MRTLKKALSLVLVLAMVFALAVPGFAADKKGSDFTDYDKVTNKEAVDVLTAIGVINGNTDGSFGADGNFTRAQAATMLAYLTLGKTIADALPTAATQFNDVPATFWGAKYIQYCADAGYITGYGDGNFGPDDTLTATQWSLMLLGALGYKAANEGIGGNGWEIATTRLAIQAKVATAEELTATFNRDMAAKLALNALKADTVWYDGGSKIVVNGVEIVNGAELKKVEDASSASKNNIVNDNVIQLAEKTFPKLKLEGDVTGDAFGRPATQWTLNGTVIGTFASSTPAFTFTSAMTEKAIFAAVGAAGIQGSSDKYIVMDKIFINGALQGEAQLCTGSTTQYEGKGTGDADGTVIIAKNDTSNAAGFGNGVTVELYATDVTNHYIMVAYNEYVGTVSSITKANADKGIKRAANITGVGSFVTDDFAAGDVVLYTVGKNGIASMKAPETISGKVTKTTSAGVYTIGGVETKLSQNNTSVTLNIGTEGTWYVDSCGNVIAVKSATVASWNYAYLIKYASQQKGDNNLLGTGAKEAAEKFQMITADGEKVTLDGAFTVDSKTGSVTKFVYTGNATPSVEEGKSKLVRYTVDGNGKVNAIEKVKTSETATGVVGADNTKLTATKGVAKLDSKFVTDKTLFIAYQDATHFSVYTGYNNIPATLESKQVTDASTYEYFYAVKADGSVDDTTIAAVVMKVTSASAQTTANYVYVNTLTKSSETTADGTVFTYSDVYLDGVKGELKFLTTDPSTIAAGTLFTYTTDTKTGYATLGSKQGEALADAVEVTTIQGGYFAASGFGAEGVVYTDSSTQYFQVDSTTGEVSTATGLSALNAAYTVKVLFADKGTAANNAADLVYFTVVAK